MTIAAIVPAYNEEKNVAAVLRSLKNASIFSDVILVDDGSTDSTADVGQREGVRVITQKNTGKAGAMAAGALATNADILFFADADLIGFEARHSEAVIAPVREGRAGMSVGLRDRGARMWWILEHLLPVIGGERAILRSHFLNISQHRAAQCFGIETVMNAYCARRRIPVILVRMPGVSIIRKEQKVGFLKGFSQRVKMFWQILQTEIMLFFSRGL